MACPYHLTAGGGHWYLAKAEEMKRAAPLVDRWLAWPEMDAQVQVWVWRPAPTEVVDMNEFASKGEAIERQTAAALEEVSRETLPNGGILVHARSTKKTGVAYEYYVGFFAHEPWAFKVTASTSLPQSESVKAELRKIVVSFEAPILQNKGRHDVTPATVGIETKDGTFTPVIERNSPIPIRNAFVFTTTNDNQERVEVHVMEGESLRADQNQSVARFALTDISAGSRGAVKIAVNFFVDGNLNLHVNVTDVQSGREVSRVIDLNADPLRQYRQIRQSRRNDQ